MPIGVSLLQQPILSFLKVLTVLQLLQLINNAHVSVDERAIDSNQTIVD